jgi:type IV secretory pathway VirB10-like protein
MLSEKFPGSPDSSAIGVPKAQEAFEKTQCGVRIVIRNRPTRKVKRSISKPSFHRNFFMKFTFLPILLSIGLLAGCDDSISDKAPTTPPANATSQKPPAVAPPPPPPPQTAPAPETKTPDAPPAAANAPETPSPISPGTEEVKAEAGVGAKGKGYGDGIIATPCSVYFQMRERIFFDHMTHAMQLFKALEGHAPRSEKEFMEKIIKENGIQLPTLPPGESYRYDSSVGELMVVRSKQQ